MAPDGTCRPRINRHVLYLASLQHASSKLNYIPAKEHGTITRICPLIYLRTLFISIHMHYTSQSSSSDRHNYDYDYRYGLPTTLHPFSSTSPLPLPLSFSHAHSRTRVDRLLMPPVVRVAHPREHARIRRCAVVHFEGDSPRPI